ncbi:FdhF/YdeP family oxidoreductase [Bradyrhizobium sp. CCBAU 53421]|uniref:FdhF/YdeP family oxidoreductase n=1 Tax=Bradyrhizobium sp. CCBAU 53421 TaxID=1325120 RepID=UPI00188C04F3|nr:FdhF/YdeP family oxidoreductase [Bradyrhizobium sp. CCBAU 53421]QOZ37878.1 formate dehydrogenase [Bradyrhizobium sp. CCBAU 53421]
MANKRRLSGDLEVEPYDGPSGGWGSVRSLARSLTREHVPFKGGRALLSQNKTGGFMCVSCAWAKPADPRVFEFCENGAKATTWEITHKRVTPEFFAARTVTELESWDDHHLEAAGRLTHPMRWDAGIDKYVPVSWEAAFAEIGRELRALQPDSAVFYTSGRASLEASFMYGLFARAYGTNNLPDSSNMCHETSSVALPESIGVPVGTCTLDDFDRTDCIFFFGQNVGTSSPRMLHQLQDAARRGVPIVTFNPLRERGLEEFVNPQAPGEMLADMPTRISSQYHQVRSGGDTAAIMGIVKALVAHEDRADPKDPVIDWAFVNEHTHGWDDFAEAINLCEWSEIERRSGLQRDALEAAAAVYARSKAVMFIYGMGLTQHERGVETVQTLINLALMRGNIGRAGAGICPVRGHSNVQGQRTVGITEKPAMVPADKIRQQFGIDVPEKKGLTTVEACAKIIEGSVRAMVLLGGNLVRAVPEHRLVEPAWRKLRLTVNILTKLNRSALIHGEVSYILPCLGRIEFDEQASGRQAVAMEDSTGCMHGSRAQVTPASQHLLSEPKIIAELAKAAAPGRSTIPWDDWVADYSRIRDAIAATYPDIFHDFNARLWQPGGFHRPLAARKRQWKTKTGKANFIAPASLASHPKTETRDPDVVQLITLRSNGQFNTTIYSYDDRFRGVYGSRHVVLMHPGDIARFALKEGAMVTLATAASDGVTREVGGLRIVAYDIPQGCIAGYYPECNPLLPLWHHEMKAKTPAAKSIPVRVRAET